MADCAHCGIAFQANPRARRIHRYCDDETCQRARRRLAQRARRALASGPPSRSQHRARAKYMRDYRERDDDYRERERRAALERWRRRRLRNEAGSTRLPASVYVVPGDGRQVEVRIVAEAGFAVSFAVAVPWPGFVTKPGEPPAAGLLALPASS